MTKPFSKYNHLKVNELKELLKKNNLPISGTKKDLVNRLEENDSIKNLKENTIGSGKKVIFKCEQCSTKLKIPKSYNGNIKCPVCSFEQELNGENIKGFTSFDELDTSNILSFFVSVAQIINQKVKSLDSKKVSLIFSVSSAILILISIITFFSAFSYEAMCQEEYRSTVMIDGEEVLSCNGGNWLETEFASKLFNACCIFLPLSLTLAIIGYGARKEYDERLSISDPTKNNQDGKFILELQNTEKEKGNTLIDKTTKVFQFSILGFSFGLTALTIVGIILITIFFIAAIYAILSSGSLFA